MLAVCLISLSGVVWSGLLLRCALSFFFQAEDGIRDLVRSRGLGDVYKRQVQDTVYGEWTTEPGDPCVAFQVRRLYRTFNAQDLSLIHI